MDEMTLSPALPEEEDKMSLPSPAVPTPSDTEIADKRSVKYSFALGDQSPGPKSIRESVMAGFELDLRRQFASDINHKNNQLRSSLIEGLASFRQGPVTDQEVQMLAGLTGTKLEEGFETIFEKEFARQYTNTIMNLDHIRKLRDPFLGAEMNTDQGKAIGNINEQGKFVLSELPHIPFDHAQKTGQHQEIFRRIHEDLLQRKTDSGYAKFIGAELYNMIPGTSWIFQYFNEPEGVPSDSFLPGSRMADRVQSLYMGDPALAGKRLKAATDSLWNKGRWMDAIALAEAAVQYGSSNMHWNNIGAAIDISMLPIGKAVKGLWNQSEKLVETIAKTGAGKALKSEEVAVEASKGFLDTPDGRLFARLREAGAELEADAAKLEFIFNKTKLLEQAEERLTEKLGNEQAKRIKEQRGLLGIRTQEVRTVYPPNIDPRVDAMHLQGEDVASIAVRTGLSVREVRSQIADLETFYKNLTVSLPKVTYSDLTPAIKAIEGIATDRLYLHISQDEARVLYTNLQNIMRTSAEKTPTKQQERIQKSMNKLRKYFEDSVPRPADDVELRNLTAIVEAGKRPLSPNEVASLQAKLEEIRDAARKSIQALANEPVTAEKILAATGDVAKAAPISVFKQVKNMLLGKDPFDNMKGLIESLPSVWDASNWAMKNVGKMSRESAGRIALTLGQSGSLLQRALMSPPNIARLTDEALALAVKEAQDKLGEQFKHISNGIIDYGVIYGQRRNDQAGTLTNVNYATARIGDNRSGKAELFTGNNAWDQAKYFAEEIYKLPEYTIQRNGGSYWLEVRTPVNETIDAARNSLITTNNTVPVTLANMLLGRLRSSQDVTSTFNTEARHLATHGSQAMQSIMKEVAENITKTKGMLNNEEFKNLRRILEINRADRKYWDTLGDFETNYFKTFGRQPSEREAIAYFTTRQLNDFDFLLRNLGLVRDLERQGIQHWSFPFIDKNGKPQTVGNFYGRDATKSFRLDPGDRAAGVLVIDQNGTRKFYQRTDLTKETKAYLDDLLKNQNYKVVQIANPLERPVADAMIGAGASRHEIVNFVITKDATQHNLPWNLVPYRPGGHVEYANGYFVKQGLVTFIGGKHRYEGDVTVFSFATEAEAKKYAARMNEARRLFAEGKDAELDVFLSKNLPFTKDKFVEFFTKKGDNPSTWNVEEPFHAIEGGRMVKDIDLDGMRFRYKDKFIAEHDSPYNLFAHVDKKFLGSRDETLWTIKELGTEQAPIFNLENAKMIDPLVTLNRSVSNSTHQRMFNDYKYLSVESWVQQFSSTLREKDPQRLRTNPHFWLQQGAFDETADPMLLAAAKASRRAILDFIGTDAPDVATIKWFHNKAISQIYEKMGQKYSDYVAEHTLPSVVDPTKYARAIAFHSKLGLFNPVQLLNQMQTMIHSIAVAGPVNGTQGAGVGTLLSMLHYTDNPAIIDKFAGIAANLRLMSRDEFKEMYTGLKRSGWDIVQGETAWRNDVMDPKLFQSAAGKFLDAGTVFFQTGERMSRNTGWATAFIEWKKANPGKILDDVALQKILSRADTLNVNMTRSSQSAWQTGIASIPMQFLTYQTRLFEQLWGGRLTNVEKARALLTYSAMYGLPTTAGLGVSFWPMYDSIRQSALERGYDLEGTSTKFLMNGLPSMMIDWATGNETDFAKRFGPQGLNQLHDLIHGDKKWYEFLWGASGGVIADIAQSADPIAQSVIAIMQGKHADFPLLTADLVDSSKNISTMNNFLKAFTGLSWHKYVTKNELAIDDINNTEAIMLGLGLTPRRVMDAFLMGDSLKKLKSNQDEIKKLVIQQYNRGMQAASQDDYDTARKYFIRARTYLEGGHFQEHQKSDIMAEAFSRHGNYRDRIKYDFFIKKAPAGSSRTEDYKDGKLGN